MFPIAALRGLIASKEQEKKLWNYIGPSIIQLNPNMFARLQTLDSLQIKILLKNSQYEWYDKGKTFTLENGGILFEGIIEEYHSHKAKAQENLDDSFISESEKGFEARTVKIKSYAFIYPSNVSYMAKSDIRLYSFPESLKESWFTFNPQILAEAFSILPGAQASMTGNNTLRGNQNTYLNKQKTHLLGISKGLAHKNPVQTFRQAAGKISDKNIPEYGLPPELQNHAGEGTIIPKGYTRAISKLESNPTKHNLDHKLTNLNEKGHETVTKGATKNLTGKKKEENTKENDKDEIDPKDVIIESSVSKELESTPDSREYSDSEDENEPDDEEDEDSEQESSVLQSKSER